MCLVVWLHRCGVGGYGGVAEHFQCACARPDTPGDVRLTAGDLVTFHEKRTNGIWPWVLGDETLPSGERIDALQGLATGGGMLLGALGAVVGGLLLIFLSPRFAILDTPYWAFFFVIPGAIPTFLSILVAIPRRLSHWPQRNPTVAPPSLVDSIFSHPILWALATAAFWMVLAIPLSIAIQADL